MVGYLINLLGQFLDALLCIYFLHKFFSIEKGKREYFWIAAAAVMTAVTQIVDYVSGNNAIAWMLLLFGLPLLYVICMEQGSLPMKILVSELPCVILISLENFAVALIGVMGTFVAWTPPVFLTVYFFRRIIFKLVLLLAVRFLLNYSVNEVHYKFRKHWYVLGALDSVELFILMSFRGPSGDFKNHILYLVIFLFCFFVPILFYYMMYLTEENLRKLQVSISQKNYIETQDRYMKQLLRMDDCMRKFRHDYKAHLFCIDNLLLEENYGELHEYLKHLHGMKDTYYEIRPYTADNRLNVILNQMREMAESRDVRFEVMAKDASIKKVELYDLNMLLTNLFTNAVEAAVLTEKKSVELEMGRDRAYLKIVMVNSVKTDTLRINPNMFTNKADKEMHGFGMSIIQSVVEKYQGILRIDSTEEKMKMGVFLMDEE